MLKPNKDIRIDSPSKSSEDEMEKRFNKNFQNTPKMQDGILRNRRNRAAVRIEEEEFDEAELDKMLKERKEIEKSDNH